MTILDISVDGKPKKLYMDGFLSKQLINKVRANVNKKDSDYCLIVDGAEGSGKSVFSQQVAKVLDPNFNLSRMCFTPEEFTKAILNARKGQCVVFDEAFTGLSSRASLSEVNRLLVSLMMEMRQKNLFVIIVMPTYFLLDRYVALWRAKGLCHVYTSKGKRGRWMYFNKNKKKMLYLKGKQTYSYSWPKSSFKGRFLDQYTLNEKKYREKKHHSLIRKSHSTKAAVYRQQRDSLLLLIQQELKIPLRDLSTKCKEVGFSIAKSAISEAIKARKIELADYEIRTEAKEEFEQEEGSEEDQAEA